MTRAFLSTLATPILATALFSLGCSESTPSVAADAGGELPDAAGDCATGAACAADAGSDVADAAIDGNGNAAGCTGSGGTIGTGTCCAGTSDFPNTCPSHIGACSCAPAASHEVKVCACARTECFDGTRCVTP